MIFIQKITIKHVVLQNFNKIVFSLRENLNLMPSFVEAAKSAGRILAVVTTQSPATLSPAMPILLGILTVTILTAIIVCRKIHHEMMLDPANIIAKE